MTTETPVLHVFAISHYCEKARWALDYLGINYTLNHAAPGEHAKLAKRLGARKSSVPYLEFDGAAIQGSSDILSLEVETEHEMACEMERRIDEVAGVHVRRYYYSEALVEHPETVRPLFTRTLSFPKNVLIRFAFPKIRSIMIKAMDLGDLQGEDSKQHLEQELDWLDGLLADGREYLLENRFSRVDIAVASLLSPLVLPPAHPVYKDLSHPPRLAEQVASWGSRPSLAWVKEIYARHR